MKRTFLLALVYCITIVSHAQFVTGNNNLNTFSITDASIYVETTDMALVQKSAGLLQQDIERVTGKKLPIIHKITGAGKTVIIIGSLEKSSLVQQLVQQKKNRHKLHQK